MNYGPQVTASARKLLRTGLETFRWGRKYSGPLSSGGSRPVRLRGKRDHFLLRGTTSNGSVEGKTNVFQDSVGRQLKIRRVRFQANRFGLVRKAERKY